MPSRLYGWLVSLASKTFGVRVLPDTRPRAVTNSPSTQSAKSPDGAEEGVLPNLSGAAGPVAPTMSDNAPVNSTTAHPEPSQQIAGDTFSGTINGGNNGGRFNSNNIFNTAEETTDAKLTRVEALMGIMDVGQCYLALGELLRLERSLDDETRRCRHLIAGVKGRIASMS